MWAWSACSPPTARPCPQPCMDSAPLCTEQQETGVRRSGNGKQAYTLPRDKCPGDNALGRGWGQDGDRAGRGTATPCPPPGLGHPSLLASPRLWSSFLIHPCVLGTTGAVSEPLADPWLLPGPSQPETDLGLHAPCPPAPLPVGPAQTPGCHTACTAGATDRGESPGDTADGKTRGPRSVHDAPCLFARWGLVSRGDVGAPTPPRPTPRPSWPQPGSRHQQMASPPGAGP